MSFDTVRVGIVGAGNRGQQHASEYERVDRAEIAAVADIDEEVATALAREHGTERVYTDYKEMLDDTAIDAISVCVHNNLHAPVSIDALEAGKHVFCEKPMAGSYADARRMSEAAKTNNRQLGVQNVRLFEPETTAAERLISRGELGDIAYARSVFNRRRGRPYIDGYGTPSFVHERTAGGGAVFDIGTYVIGRMLLLLGNPSVERVTGQTWNFTDDQLSEEMVGDNSNIYHSRLDETDYSLEDCGVGTVRLGDGTRLDVHTAWHTYAPDEPEYVAGSTGSVQLDPFEFRTTIDDYEATVDLDIENYEARHGLLESETGYDIGERLNQFDHWIQTLCGAVDPVPTGEIALRSMLIMEGIYLSEKAGRELSAEEIAERSESTAMEP